ncbi:hypothetical protein BJY52DRAFT_561210 [Lactarius psammicola]|nr:hypothetical protein BJY52DRAFT_561210 [Lactarius psammicola]
MQSVGGALCNFYSTVGSIIRPGLPGVRSPFEESAISTVFFRGWLQNTEHGGNSLPADSYLAFPIFLGPGDSMRNTNRTVGITTIIIFCYFGSAYIQSVSTHLINPRSPYEAGISTTLVPINMLRARWRRRSRSAQWVEECLKTGRAPVIPQLIFPGHQVQVLGKHGLKLCEVLDRQAAERYEEVLGRLKFVDQVSASLRRPNGLMRRQLWRLQDIRDGGGLGFTTELFFLSLRQLLSMRSLQESNSVLYNCAFKIITPHWMESRESLGT